MVCLRLNKSIRTHLNLMDTDSSTKAFRRIDLGLKKNNDKYCSWLTNLCLVNENMAAFIDLAYTGRPFMSLLLLLFLLIQNASSSYIHVDLSETIIPYSNNLVNVWAAMHVQNKFKLRTMKVFEWTWPLTGMEKHEGTIDQVTNYNYNIFFFF